MKRLICALIAAFILFGSTAAHALSVNAKAAILIEASSGRVIYSKNENEKLPMASTTKVITLLVAVENGHLNDKVTVSANAANTEGSKMYLRAGDIITLEDLLYGLMLVSGNDAAVAIAEYVGGSVEGFAQLMNETAEKLGATNTNFVTPNGLHNDNHYTTAHDLAVIAAHAIQNPIIETIINTKSHTVNVEGNVRRIKLTNKNKFLTLYKDANGFKTGFTNPAGRCLVSASKRGGLQFIGVVLNCYDMYIQSAAMHDLGYETLEMKQLIDAGELVSMGNVSGGIKKDLEIYASDAIIVPIAKDGSDDVRLEIEVPDKIKAPVYYGQIVGQLKVYVDDTLAAQQDLIAGEHIACKDFGYYLSKIWEFWPIVVDSGAI